jgi:hypothetical protein
MDNQHKKIKGYRDLTQAEIDLMNEVKAKGEELRALVKKIRESVIPPATTITAVDVQESGLVASTAAEGVSVPYIEHEADYPEFWLRWADNSFRAALMYATRAIAQPTSY